MLFEHEIFEMQYDFPKMGGGIKVRLELFRKFINIGTVARSYEACVDFDQIDNNDFYSSTS